MFRKYSWLLILLALVACSPQTAISNLLSEKPVATFQTLVGVDGHNPAEQEIFVTGFDACGVELSEGGNFEKLSVSGEEIRLEQGNDGVWAVYADSESLDFDPNEELNCSEVFEIKVLPMEFMESYLNGDFSVTEPANGYQFMGTFRLEDGMMVTTDSVYACAFKVGREVPTGYEGEVQIIPDEGKEVRLEADSGDLEGDFKVFPSEDSETICPVVKEDSWLNTEVIDLGGDSIYLKINVVDEQLSAISNARVNLEVPGQLYPKNHSDSNGLAVFDVTKLDMATTVVIVVSKDGYLPVNYRQTVTLGSAVANSPTIQLSAQVPSE